MKICHVCKEECLDTAELCPICGADLSDNEENANNIDVVEESSNDIIIKNPVVLASVDDVITSEILKDLLRENGIPFNCGNNEETTLRVTFGGAFAVDDFYVDDKDFEKAFEIYENLLNNEPEFDEEFFEETENS